MTITASDIKILASERMRDTADGGGHATAIALQSGVENAVFPDVSDSDRVWGYLRLRKVYAAVVNAGTDTLLGAYAILEDMPDDPATTAWIDAGGSISTERATAVTTALGSHWNYVYASTWTVSGADRKIISGSHAPKVGMVVAGLSPPSAVSSFAVITAVTDLGSGSYQCTFDGWPDAAWAAGVPGSFGYVSRAAPYPAARCPKSTLAVAGTLASGATSITCSSALMVPVVPKALGIYAVGAPELMGFEAGQAFDAAPAGSAPCVVPGDIVVVHHTAETSPTMVISGSIVSCGRTALASARVIGANGAEIVSGFTIDLAAGTVTVNDPTGWSQPVKVRHRIEDVLGCAYVDADEPGKLYLNRGLSRAFPSGTLLSSALPLGDLQALVAAVFSQSLWTSVWADARIGSPIVGQYDDVGHPIVVTNRDAITERWAVEFLTSTAFRVFGEQLGEITTGSVNTALAPINPATGQPYFTLAATGWGDGWSAGNVLRFNTVGAAAPIWVARVVLPSAPGAGADSLTLAIKGNIDA